ncbi:MAG: response regulator transcription factor [Lachnospiraceae bacterium]|nr:response regulator transcription factor [Lachnospiraceae bacterium]
MANTGNNKYKILVIEDELNIRSFVSTILDANHYQVLTADTCSQGLLVFSSYVPDLIILDLGLPDADGLSFIRHVRLNSTTPIIVLSARSGEQDKVTALDLGANDYITKPFGTAELLARVRAIIRSRHQLSHPGTEGPRVFVLHDLSIDYDSRQVTVSGREIHLTQTEYNIVALLSQHAGKVLTYTAIIRRIWGEADPGSIKKLQVNMANIRKKLGLKPGENHYITNELGVGYRMYHTEDPSSMHA